MSYKCQVAIEGNTVVIVHLLEGIEQFRELE